MKDEIRCSIECREDETRRGPGRLVGTVITYGQRAKDRPELFEPGALTWPADGVVLNRQHARGAPIMRVVPELRSATRLSSTKRSLIRPRAETRRPRSAAGSCAVYRCRFRLANSRLRAACAVSHAAALTAIGPRGQIPRYDAPVEVRARRDGRRYRRVWQ